MTLVTLLSAVSFAAIFLLSLTPTIHQIVASTSFFIMSIDVLLIYFGPKVFPFYKNEFQLSGISKYVPKISPAPSTIEIIEETGEATDEVNDFTSHLIVAGYLVLRHKDIDEKNKICLEQIGRWQGMLLRLGDEGQSVESRSNGIPRDSLLSKPVMRPGSLPNSLQGSRQGSRQGSPKTKLGTQPMMNFPQVIPSEVV